MNITTYHHNKETGRVSNDLVQPISKFLRTKKVQWSKGSGTAIKKAILDETARLGWTKSVKLDASSGISIGGIKDAVASSVQFGNMSRAYADLLKMEYLFRKGRASGAILILPTKAAGKKFGSNIASYDRIVKELPLFADIITIPVLVIGVED